MNNYKTIVTRLREFLKSGDLTAIQDEHRNVIADYYLLVKQANDRLQEMESFLQKGLYAEAVHAAQIDPDLIDVVTTLNIAERDVLEMVIASYNNVHDDKIPPVPALATSTAEALNRAYVSVESLDNLLKIHRLLALARAPLVERRNVLLNIIQRDPDNLGSWKDDQVVWETELVKQLHSFLNKPDVHNDPEALLQKIEVLNDGQWRIELPADLIKNAESKRRKAEESLCRLALTKLIDPCLEAYQLRDYDGARQLMVKWQEKAEAAQLSSNDPIHTKVSAVFQWVNSEQDSRERSAHKEAARLKMVKVLQSGASVSELVAAWQQYENVVGTPDELIRSQYRDVKQRREESGRRRYHMTLAGCVTLGLILLTSVILSSVYFMNQAKLTARLVTLEENKRRYLDAKYISKEHAAETDTLFATIRDELGERDEVERYRREFNQFLQDQQKRETEVATLFEECRTLSEKDASPELLSRLRNRVRSSDERDRLGAVEKEHDNRHRLWKEQRRNEVEQQLAELSHLIKDAGKMLEKEGAAASSMLSEIDKRLKAFDKLEEHSDWKLIRASDEKLWQKLEVRKHLISLQAEFDERKATLEQIIQSSAELTLLDKSFAENDSRVASYVARLKQFIKNFPRSSQARAFANIASTLQPEIHLEQWGLVIKALQFQLFAATPGMAKEALRMMPETVQLPAEERENRQILNEVMKMRALCVLEPGSPASKLDAYFQLPGIKDAYIVMRSSINPGSPSEVYYFSEADYKAYATVFGKDKPDTPVRYYRNLNSQPTINRINLANFVYPGDISPQSKVAKLWNIEIKPTILTSEQAWRDGLVRMIVALQESDKFDPVGKVFFLKECCLALSKTSWIGKQAAATQIDYFLTAKHLPNGTENWLLNPSDGGKSLEEHRANAVSILAKYPPLTWKDYVEKAKELEKAEQSRLISAPVPIGWLHRQGDQWLVQGQVKLWDQHDVFVLLRDSRNGLTLQKIGMLQGGNFVRSSAVNESMLQIGQPCFVRATSNMARGSR
jgi:hypothetical protein